jgi:hypothetical protein
MWWHWWMSIARFRLVIATATSITWSFERIDNLIHDIVALHLT